MSAKDYQIMVSAPMGTIYIGKPSKRDPRVMLDDRKEVPDNHMYQIIEQFAQAKIKPGFSVFQVKQKSGELVFEIHLPNPKLEARYKNYKEIAHRILEACKDTPDEKVREMPGIPLTLVSLAKMVVELTS